MQVRYTQRICSDSSRIDSFLSEERIGILGLDGGEYPYAVPVNFVWHHGSIYIHGMGSGKKAEILARKPQACFTVYKEFGTVTDPLPCHADTAYMSVMLFGEMTKLTDSDLAAEVMQKLVEKYLPGYYAKNSQKLSGRFIEKYRSALDGKGALVYQLTPDEMTAKENRAEPGCIFGNHE